MPPYTNDYTTCIIQHCHQHQQQQYYIEQEEEPITSLTLSNNSSSSNFTMGGITAINYKKIGNASWPSFILRKQSNAFLEQNPADASSMVDINLLLSETSLNDSIDISKSNNDEDDEVNDLMEQQQQQQQQETTAKTLAELNHDDPHFKPLKKQVSFTEINIREHSVVLGDHPCCTIGLPVALGWEVQNESSQSLDAYEANRCKRRSRHEMRLSLTDRRNLLSDYSDDAVRRVTRQLHKERRCMGRRAKKQFFSTANCDDDVQQPKSAVVGSE